MGAIEGHIRFLALVFLAVLLLCVLTPLSGYASLMIVCSITAIVLGFVAIKLRETSLLWPIIMFVYARLFLFPLGIPFQHLMILNVH